MRKVKIRSKRQLDAHNVADAAVLDARARRAREVINGPTIRPPTPAEIEHFSVGGCSSGCSTTSTPPCGPTPSCVPEVPICRPGSINDCYHELATKHGCPLKVTSGGELRVDGQERIEFQVEPTQSNYFLPVAVRLSGRAADDPDQNRVWQLTAPQANNPLPLRGRCPITPPTREKPRGSCEPRGFFSSGADGARTRDLRRDRPAL